MASFPGSPTHRGGWASLSTWATRPSRYCVAYPSPWVITGQKRDKPLRDVQYWWHRIREQAELEEVRIHDLQHSYARGGLLVGEGLPMIGKLLGHNHVRTTA